MDNHFLTKSETERFFSIFHRMPIYTQSVCSENELEKYVGKLLQQFEEQDDYEDIDFINFKGEDNQLYVYPLIQDNHLQRIFIYENENWKSVDVEIMDRFYEIPKYSTYFNGLKGVILSLSAAACFGFFFYLTWFQESFEIKNIALVLIGILILIILFSNLYRVLKSDFCYYYGFELSPAKYLENLFYCQFGSWIMKFILLWYIVFALGDFFYMSTYLIVVQMLIVILFGLAISWYPMASEFHECYINRLQQPENMQFSGVLTLFVWITISHFFCNSLIEEYFLIYNNIIDFVVLIAWYIVPAVFIERLIVLSFKNELKGS